MEERVRDDLFDRIAELRKARDVAWEMKQRDLAFSVTEDEHRKGKMHNCEILRGALWIGDGLNTTLLDMSEKVQAIISLGTPRGQARFQCFPHIPQRTHHLRIEIEDDTDEQICNYFEKCSTFIHTHIEEEGNIVFVHCEAGVSRSATICIAYLMRHCRMSFMAAYMCVKEARYIICPNAGFIDQLITYEAQLNEL